MTRSEKIKIFQVIATGQANIESLIPAERLILISGNETEQKANEAKFALLN